MESDFIHSLMIAHSINMERNLIGSIPPAGRFYQIQLRLNSQGLCHMTCDLFGTEFTEDESGYPFCGIDKDAEFLHGTGKPVVYESVENDLYQAHCPEPLLPALIARFLNGIEFGHNNPENQDSVLRWIIRRIRSAQSEERPTSYPEICLQTCRDGSWKVLIDCSKLNLHRLADHAWSEGLLSKLLKLFKLKRGDDFEFTGRLKNGVFTASCNHRSLAYCLDDFALHLAGIYKGDI
jgi:hypothetical protein